MEKLCAYFTLNKIDDKQNVLWIIRFIYSWTNLLGCFHIFLFFNNLIEIAFHNQLSVFY